MNFKFDIVTIMKLENVLTAHKYNVINIQYFTSIFNENLYFILLFNFILEQ